MGCDDRSQPATVTTTKADPLDCGQLLDHQPDDLMLPHWGGANPGNEISEGEVSLKTVTADISGIPNSISILKSLKQATNLRWLRIGPSIEASDLSTITEMKQLEGLCIVESDLPDGCFRAIGSLPNLKWLAVVRCNPSERQFGELSGCKQLEELHFWGSHVDDTALQTLRQFPKLRSLSIVGSSVTDDGVRDILRDQPNIEYLSLFLCRRITPGVFLHLKEASGLKSLAIGSSGAVPFPSGNTQLMEFKTSRPDCSVDFYD